MFVVLLSQSVDEHLNTFLAILGTLFLSLLGIALIILWPGIVCQV